jgi:hypothetical protein
VAALTLPALIAQHQKIVTVSKLKKLYTSINQSVRLSEVDNGPVAEWNLSSSRPVLDIYNDYFAKYIASTYVGECGGSFVGGMCVDLPDGVRLRFTNPSGGLRILAMTDRSEAASVWKSRFYFSLMEPYSRNFSEGNRYVFEPYSENWNGTRESLISHPSFGCNKTSTYASYCTKLLQYDGWEIKDDYPW